MFGFAELKIFFLFNINSQQSIEFIYLKFGLIFLRTKGMCERVDSPHHMSLIFVTYGSMALVSAAKHIPIQATLDDWFYFTIYLDTHTPILVRKHLQNNIIHQTYAPEP